MIEENVGGDQMVLREAVYAALRRAYDPLYAINILEMGLVDHVSIEGGTVTVMLRRPYQDTRSCDDLIQSVLRAIQQVPGAVAGAVGFVATPAWDTTMLSPSLRHMFGLDRDGRNQERSW